MRERFSAAGIPLLITLAGFLLAYQFVDPAPPDELSISTGQHDGSYLAFGKRYKAALKLDDINLNVMPSAGSVENLKRLQDGVVDAAFIQGGIASESANPELTFLGSLYFEPLWLFHRSELSLTRLSGLRGKRIAMRTESK